MAAPGNVPPVAFPVSTQNDLPPVGGGREQFDFDCKGDVDETDTFELARDVAAFANLAGGVILVGAVEDPARGVIRKYRPMAEERAHLIAGAYSKSVAQRCSPAPLIDPTVLPLEGAHIVGVNVWPFPAQVVGVRIPDAETFRGTRVKKPVLSKAPKIQRLNVDLALIPIEEILAELKRREAADVPG